MQSMVEMLNIPQIYGTQYHDHQIHHEYHTTKNNINININTNNNNNNNNNNNTIISNQILDEKISNSSYYNNNNNKTKNYQSLKSNTKTITAPLTSITQTATTTTATITTTNDSQHNKGGGGGGRGAVFTDIYASLSSLQSIKSPTHYIEKFINLDLFKNYERLKLSNKYLPTYGSLSAKSVTDNVFYNKKVPQQHQQQRDQDQEIQSKISVNEEDNTLKELNCLEGKNRNKFHIDADVAGIYESVRFNVQNQLKPSITTTNTNTNMINKCSHNFLAENVQNAPAAAATLQHFQKLPECDQDLPKDTVNSGPSSSTSDVNSDNPIYRHLHMPSYTSPNKRNPIERITKNGSVRIYVDACPIYSQAPQNANESASENSSSSIAATTTTTYSSSTVQRTSSASSSGEYQGSYHALNYATYENTAAKSLAYMGNDTAGNTQLERLQRRKLMQMIASLDQQNKALQRELLRERRRRSEELSRVVKSLLCFESKLKSDMKSANQRMQEKDIEICRLTRQNRALKKGYLQAQKNQHQDEGVIVTDDSNQAELLAKLGMDACQAQAMESNLLEDCLVLEALQCINCRKQFYDIGSKEGWTQTSKNKEEHTTEHGSSSDDTVSSSFYGARRSVRYTSKRTSGTFGDYLRSRAMQVDDTLMADGGNWENASTLSRDSQSSHTSNEKMNCGTQNANIDAAEEDDGIFSPTQDDEFEDDTETNNSNNNTLIVAAVNKQVQMKTRAATTATQPEFSEASPKQIYETSADDWYASASDQDDLAEGCNTKCYTTLAAVNPVLECVNQILLQQTMEETGTENKQQPDTNSTVTVQLNLPRRSSLSGRRQGRSNSTSEENSHKGVVSISGSGSSSVRNKTMARKRVHFSTKNSMVHLPRHESDNEQELEKVDIKQLMIPINTHYFSTTPSKSTMIKINATSPPATTGMTLVMQDGSERLDTLNYESIYSNEYEPIGSEQNSSNLYVEMETERLKCIQKTHEGVTHNDVIKVCKTPPELPPKPANLMKFKKSLLQVNEVRGEHNHNSSSSSVLEPEYCSISEVNVGITSVQIVADVHKAPESVMSSNDLETSNKNFPELTFAAEEVATINSDETCAASQKTEEVEEIFADIPKLPNVAAIIVPKQAKYHQEQQQNMNSLNQKNKSILSDYLSMTPKSNKFQTVQKLLINSSDNNDNLRLANTHKVVISNNAYKNNNNNHNNNNNNNYNNNNNSLIKINSSCNLLKDLEAVTIAGTLPLQEEFDWYNLDAEYGKAKVSVNEHKVQNGILEEINEDHEHEHESERECIASTADEYKLDEEFCLATENVQVEETETNNNNNIDDDDDKNDIEVTLHEELNAVIRENIESRNKAKKLHKNLDTFEKFIEGSGLSTKPLPHKRKIYFAGPFV